MSNQQKRPASKRLAVEADNESDDDFQFTRKSKKPRTEEAAQDVEPVKKPTRGRPAAKGRVAKETATAATSTKTTKRKSSRQKADSDASPDAPPPKAPRRSTRNSGPLEELTTEDSQVNGTTRKQGRGKAKSSRPPKWLDDSPPQETSVASAKITLPMSDTPIINRNKAMRNKANTNRRSSLGTRGRRASSLIESGQTAIPHREVDAAQFYKHIEAEGLTEPRRMKQLLTWCGERSLSEKPPHGTPNSNAILGARAIQDQLLKDFASRSDFSDWFSRDDDPSKAPAVLRPNPRNIELDKKLTDLEEKVKRLEEEKEAWLAIRHSPPEQPPLFTDSDAQEVVLPDFNLLDEDDGRIRGFLADETQSFLSIRLRTESKLRKMQSSLEFEVDQLADNVHKLEQRVSVASKEADQVLGLSALRLHDREGREKMSVGTKDMPIMEVLRSLGKILPEGG